MRNLNATRQLPLICVVLIGAIAIALAMALPAAAQSDDEKIGTVIRAKRILSPPPTLAKRRR